MISTAVPVIVVAWTVTTPVVLALRVLSADAETDASVTVIVYAFPVSFSPARVAISPVEIVPVTIPEVRALTALACATVTASVIVIASLPRPDMPEDV